MDTARNKAFSAKDKKRRRILIGSLLLFGFAALEFPGILFVCFRVEPFIFGLPFLYGYVLCGWVFMCGVLFFAWRTGWGKHPFRLWRER